MKICLYRKAIKGQRGDSVGRADKIGKFKNGADPNDAGPAVYSRLEIV